ncbi:MAG TPA: M15 family metallopeptidase [Solirubrobacterales bacterium]|jgi:hypothetical protein
MGARVGKALIGVAALLAAAALALPGGPGEGARVTAQDARDPARAAPPFEAQIRRIKGDLRRHVKGTSWRSGCPVPLRELRHVRVVRWDFEGRVKRGRLIVHRRHARRIVKAMRRLYRKRFPIRRMHLIDRYGADDRRSMAADNTSAFNCRYVAGTTRWSMHAYGKAIDINPRENPYVTPSGHVSPPQGRPYADRSRTAKGMVKRGGPAFNALRRVGWEWGGDWSGTKDYMHFSANGR